VWLVLAAISIVLLPQEARAHGGTAHPNVLDLGYRIEATDKLGLMLQLNALHRARDAGSDAEPEKAPGLRFLAASDLSARERRPAHFGLGDCGRRQYALLGTEMKRTLVAAVLALFASAVYAQHGSHGAHDSAANETAFGRAAPSGQAKRIVRVEMSDAMRFTPAEVTVKRGEIVRFLPVNKGQVMHEMVLGTMSDLKKHAALMQKSPGMKHEHEPHMTHVAPGASGDLAWQFTHPGEFYFACLIPGHFEAGMIGKVIVR
jgi:uncharacterized cupredoxin-like copper-binding protein